MSFRFPPYIKYLFLVYLTGIAFFTVFRIAFVIAHWEFANDVPLNILAQAFIMGFRFDTVVCSYLLTVPFFALAILSFFKMDLHRQFVFANGFFFAVFTFSFLVCGIDIPYFTHFNSRFTHSALFWFDTPGFILKIIFTTPVYWLYLAFFIMLSIFFLFLLNKIKKKVLWSMKEIAPFAKPFLFAFSAGIIFLGIRGRVGEKSPIRWGTAFFSEYGFANQMGLNPVFTLFKTTVDSYKPETQHLNFMSGEQAIAHAKKFLNVPDSATYFERKISFSPNPIAIGSLPDSYRVPTPNHNIIVVIMESMSARYLKANGNPHDVTPVLDSLLNVSLNFSNFYSAGIHTYNGVYSSLFGMPSLLSRHPMKDFENMNQPSGIAKELKKCGYNTLFICTHDEQFDNMGGFMQQNGFDKVISQKDYKKEEILSTLGVPDHILFREVIDRCRNRQQPFFTAVLTGSNHPPMIIPQGIDFTPHRPETDLQGVEYADWSIGQFLKNARKEKWFNNTIFVFLGDHGRVVGPGYDVPLSYHHIPLILFAPAIFKENKNIPQLGSQIDLTAILMGILNLEWTNTTLGMDILNQQREMVFFSADNNLACLNDSAFYVQRESGVNSLYFYRNDDLRDYLQQYPQLAARMKLYAQCMVQAAQEVRGKE